MDISKAEYSETSILVCVCVCIVVYLICTEKYIAYSIFDILYTQYYTLHLIVFT